jgi:hypothetical protein
LRPEGELESSKQTSYFGRKVDLSVGVEPQRSEDYVSCSKNSLKESISRSQMSQHSKRSSNPSSRGKK